MAENGIVVSEQTELQEILKKIESHPKLGKWLQLFLDKDNKQTYGNKTQSALQAYNLDPATQYSSASVIGYENFIKLKIVAQAYYDRDGMSVGKVLDLIAHHAIQGKAKALEMLAVITDAYNPKANIVINNTQNNTNTITNVKADDPRIAQVNKDFQEFIEAKYAKKPQAVEDTSEG